MRPPFPEPEARLTRRSGGVGLPEAERSPARRAQGALAREVRQALAADGSWAARLQGALASLERHAALERSVLYALHGGRLEVVAQHGLGAPHYRPRLGSGVAGRAAHSQQRIVVPQVRLDPMALSELTEPDAWLDPGWSLIALPLPGAQAPVGVLCCYSRGDRALEGGAAPDVGEAAALLAAALERALQALPAEPEARARAEGPFEYANLVGTSTAIRQVYDEIAQVARTSATTLIRGESGTGKELVACAIHQNSERAHEPLIKVNCAALPETLFESELFGHERGAYTGAHARRRGRFELAAGGTLFLDEIAELSPAMQAKLLRVLQSREFERVGGSETLRTDARVIAATNRNLEQLVQNGSFRQDLYYRLNVFSISVPPLRGRRADICALSEYFVSRHAAQHKRAVTGISHRALDLLCEHDWPGNVRELENAIERAVVVCDGFVVQERHLPASVRLPAVAESPPRSTLKEAVAALESRMLSDALARARGNCARAARELGVSERVVRYKASLYGIAPASLRGE
ncbi:MAG TPA: sigma 54-interacting transcriptional regulator [Polyangiaceae bacterium]|nr:sigma 54-interacting transcriptional regulator [Polyangiaceae bacterium]